MPSPTDFLERAQAHLGKVRDASQDPVDWSDLSLYGFYALEAAVMAASASLGWVVPPDHRAKMNAAVRLHREHGLPDITDLLRKLNIARKAAAYGDVQFPHLDAGEVAVTVENYIDRVQAMTGGST